MVPMDINAYKALDAEYTKVFGELESIYYLEVLPFGKADNEAEYSRLQSRLSEISRTMDKWRSLIDETEQILKK